MLDFGFYNMDCMDGMKEFPDNYFELAIVDPPYREKNDPMQGMRANGSMKQFGNVPNETSFKELFRVSNNQSIWGANNFRLPSHKGFLIWEKDIPEGMRFSQAEYAYISEELTTLSKVFHLRVTGAEKRIHPTQKPVALYKWLLTNYAKPGDKILDTHVGSASSLIACEDLGFNYVGFELDEYYFKLAKERITDFNAQIRMNI